MRFYPVPEIKRFGEAALRATVKRDLPGLLNTTQFGAACRPGGLSRGPDLGAELRRSRPRRPDRYHSAHDPRSAHAKFATRSASSRRDSTPRASVVEPLASKDKANTVIFLIHARNKLGVRPLPVQFRTELETDTAAVEVSE